ncbi:MAG TPA: VWA domain-containing protein [Pyrinomonadaceae bacterium]|jgi:VWFA-related protein
MSRFMLSLKRFGWALLLLCLSALFSTAEGQQQQGQAPADQADEVLRVKTELVQTDVMVFDRQGRFVDGLKPEQFELRVDGKPQAISFFERIAAGTTNEEAQLAAARGARAGKGQTANIRPLDRGRTIFFFVDDLHQAFDSLSRTRKSLLRFINEEMGQNDQVAITSASGQVGFLQQLTNNKTVLRNAVERLNFMPQSSRDLKRPPMPEYLAMAIEVLNDPDVTSYFVQQLVSEGYPAVTAESVVKSRARTIMQQSYTTTRSTLATLESLARSSSSLPGRKLIFFVSDGFLLNTRETDMLDRLRNITNAAARNGVVIYAIDSRGLSVGPLGDPTSDPPFDPSGRLARFSLGDVTISQEPLKTLAANTGGRALLNSNSLSGEITKALHETSVYYLLAWRPETEERGRSKFRRIEVKVLGHPELSVQMRRGYYDLPPKEAARPGKTAAQPTPAKAVDDELRAAIKAAYPVNTLPVLLSLSYVDRPQDGTVLMASIQVAAQHLSFGNADREEAADVSVMGLILNEQGKAVASLRENLKVKRNLANPDDARGLVHNFQARLKPGLYQVRMATRDNRSGRTGSTVQWIEIPDLASRRLALSSLLLGEATGAAEEAQTDPGALSQSVFSVDHRFARTSNLRFVTFIYNAARGTAGTESPDVALQVQVFRDDQPVITTALRRVKTEGLEDLARLPYAAEIPLKGMLAGHYVLQITVIDRIAKVSASERASFEIE